MHDALRQRLLRRIESLPDEQVYQVLDFIEFLESKYAGTEPVEASGLQKFAESLEDKLRRKAVSPTTIREAFQLISAADRVLSGVSSAGKQILTDLNQALDVPEEGGEGAPGSREGRAPRSPGRSSGAPRGAGGGSATVRRTGDPGGGGSRGGTTGPGRAGSPRTDPPRRPPGSPDDAPPESPGEEPGG